MSLDTSILLNETLQRYPLVQAIYLFGSFVDGRQTRQSDVDIALLLPPDEARRAGTLALSELQMELTEQLGRQVDLINLRMVSTVFQAEIVSSATRLYVADEALADQFDMQAMTRFQHFCFERREIVDAGLKTGFYREDST